MFIKSQAIPQQVFIRISGQPNYWVITSPLLNKEYCIVLYCIVSKRGTLIKMVHFLTVRNSEKIIFFRMCLNICSVYSSHEVLMILCKKVVPH